MSDKSPSSARSESTETTEAAEVAETPSENAETASENAETASESAETASESAETASESAETASESAETASESAGTRPGGGRTAEPVPVSPAVHKRLTTGLGGFSLAMVACLLLVGAVYLITPRSDNEVLPTVDYSGQLWAMRSDAPYTVWAPEGLPAGWRPTSSRVNGLGDGKEPVSWHLGFLTSSDEYAALEQSNEKPSEYVPRMTNNKNPLGTQQVAGITWTKYHRKDKKQNSLARTLPDGVSLVVAGTASYDELAVLAAALKPQPRQGAPLAPSPSPTF